MSRVAMVVSCVVGLAAQAYTPAYLEQKKTECTFRGQVDETCVKLYTEVVVGDNTEHVSREATDTLRTCFDDALSLDQGRGDHSEAAEKALVQQASGDAAFTNRYVDACISVTAKLRGASWLKEAKQAAAYDKLRRALNEEFESKCGVRGDFQRGSPPSIVLWAKPMKKAQFYKDTNGDGTTVTVTCDGVLTVAPKGGKAQRSSPKTIAQVRASEKAGCLGYCKQHDDICIEGARRGTTTPLCATHCRDKCG